MGNKSTKEIIPKNEYRTFMIDRILDSKYKIYVGVITGESGNDLANQGIRVGDDNIRRLVSFSESLNQLNFQFENNMHLKLMRSEDRIIYVVLRSTEYDFCFTMDNAVIKVWKSINFNSFELDRISEFCR